MFTSQSYRTLILASACAILMTGCAFIPNFSKLGFAEKGFSETEKEIKQTLSSAKYRPASREMRDNIETQELFAQAAFWSREYEINPGDLESSIKLAAAVRKLGNPQRALEIAQTSRALYPRDPYLTAEYAAALIASEQGYEAMKPLDEALRMAPGYARLWSLKGAALDQQENYELARKHYAKAMQITPNDPNIMANIGLNFALSGDPQTAEGWLRRATSIPGASNSVRQNLALVLQLQGKEAEAAKYSGQPKLRGTTNSRHPSQVSQQKASGRRSYTTASTPNTRSVSRPANQSAIPSSERNGAYKQSYSQSTSRHYPAGQIPQTTLRQGSSLAGSSSSLKTAPLTASDAARLAAQKSSRRKMTVPFVEDGITPNSEQNSVLEQISRTIGPQASGPNIPRRSLQSNVQTQANYRAATAQAYDPRAGYVSHNIGYPTSHSAHLTRRQAARSRR